jgi:predicted nucleic acid-binding Zn ribbon protein
VSDDEDRMEDIHSREAELRHESDTLSPDSGEFSTASCGQPKRRGRLAEDDERDDRQDDGAEVGAEPVDMAAGALEAARSIAGGTPRGTGAGGRPARRRRRRFVDGPSYSGARADDRDPSPIGAIVGKALPELGWVGPLAEARLMTQWASVVGADIAARCQPVSLDNGDLKVTAESTAWATQLRLMAPQILAKITAELPRGIVNKLVITGPSGPSWKHGPWAARGRGVRDTYG